MCPSVRLVPLVLLAAALVLLCPQRGFAQAAPAPVAAVPVAAVPVAAVPVAVLPVEDPKITRLALLVYHQVSAGRVDAELLTPEMQDTFAPDKLASVQPIFIQLGEPVKLSLEKQVQRTGGITYTYLATFSKAELHVQMYVTEAGKVGGYAVTM